MRDLQAIATVYEQVDQELQTLRDTDEPAGGEPPPERAAQEQSINDQAYFVLAWGQLEADIEEACRDAIRDG